MQHGRTAPEEISERARGAGILNVNKVPTRTGMLGQLPNFRFVAVAVAATGTDAVDVPACRPWGIPVSKFRAYAVHMAPDLYRQFGITPERVAEEARAQP
ncbi:hypothetical protein JHL17_07420 [Azospirillum sp. YIM B02556]|uniref:D-isomer specific 2-hydroxyacid dehydrogenase catalytic domain-containing protein n=1 Tax=Azospirillum endophyticum TaxID=2800326 RepID=A0ABS1F1E3_9PROT|nr:hypothetical protein [Azospirillum endophyticum]